MSEQLKPCPHCGERDELYPSYRVDTNGKLIQPPYAIDCLGCGSDFTPRAGTDAIAAWNRRASGEWQDIDSAPKSSAILTWGCLHEDCIGESQVVRVSWWDDATGWNSFASGSHSPTHWMPLPSPPGAPS